MRSARLKKALAYLENNYALDLRSLALMRILAGVVVFWDIIIRFSDLEAHYTDMGVLPRQAMYAHCFPAGFFSLHIFSGSAWYEGFLMGIALVFAVGLFLGYKTKLCAIVSWLLLLSLQNRNLIIGQAGDDLLRMLLFWGMFLPWGRYYSLDRRFSAQPETRIKYFSAATFAYLCQIVFVYLFTILLKTAPEWRGEGTALYYALSLDQLVLPLGELIYPHPRLLMLLTHLTCIIEWGAPILLLMPVWPNWCRGIAVVLLFGLHIGIALTLFVGLFYLISFAGTSGLIPTPMMDKLEKWFQRWGKRFQRNRPLNKIQEARPEKVSTISHSFLPGLIGGVFVLTCMFYVLIWNINTVSANPFFRYNKPMLWVGYLLRLDQHWGMFAPSVFKDDGWYVLEAELADGKLIDLNRGGQPVNYDKPAHVVQLFKNDRWRKYGENILFVSNAWMRPYYCDYLMRDWNREHQDKKIKSLDIIYMEEITEPDYRPVEPDTVSLYKCVNN